MFIKLLKLDAFVKSVCDLKVGEMYKVQRIDDLGDARQTRKGYLVQDDKSRPITLYKHEIEEIEQVDVNKLMNKTEIN